MLRTLTSLVNIEFYRIRARARTAMDRKNDTQTSLIRIRVLGLLVASLRALFVGFAVLSRSSS